MDSTDDEQEPAEEQVDSLSDDQEDDGSRTDNSAERINGLMKLVGKRTTEASEQKARADRAEAALAETRGHLLAYEAGARMSDADALAAEQASASPDSAEQELDDSDDDADDPYAEANSGFDYWSGTDIALPSGEAASTYVDPNSVSRMQSMQAHRPTDAQRLKAAFEGGLDQALSKWGWEPPD